MGTHQAAVSGIGRIIKPGRGAGGGGEGEVGRAGGGVGGLRSISTGPTFSRKGGWRGGGGGEEGGGVLEVVRDETRFPLKWFEECTEDFRFVFFQY